MTRKPTTKSPDERRLRKHIRDLLKLHDPSDRLNTDATVREFLNLIDDEVRRTRMSIAPVITPAGKPDITKPFFWATEDEPGPMTDAEYKERTQIKKVLAAAALEGKLPPAVTSRDMHVSTATPKAWKDWADKVTCGGK